MTASLYALTEDALRLEAQIQDAAERLFSDDPGEVNDARDELEGLLLQDNANREALMAKADTWCWVIDRMRATIADRKAHAKRLQALAKYDEDRADALEDKLISLLTKAQPDATGFDLPAHKITSRLVAKVELDPDLDAETLPADLRRVKYEADKTAIKERIQVAIQEAVKDKEKEDAVKAAAKAATTAVPGASLMERRSWTIK